MATNKDETVGMPTAESIYMNMVAEMAVKVSHFHAQVTKMPIPKKPTFLSPALVQEETSKINEELIEFHNAKSVVTQADAVLDAIYFAIGTLLRMGVSPEMIFESVHKANMEKIPAKTTRSQFDAKKPVNWKPPSLYGLGEMGFEPDCAEPKQQTIFPRAFHDAQHLMDKKSQDYNRKGEDFTVYFPYGSRSYAHMVHLKAQRLLNLADTDNTPNFESIDDSLLDIINYASMWYEANRG